MAISFSSHTIQKSIYNGFDVKENGNEISVNVHGSISVSKDLNPGVINVTCDFVIGNDDTTTVMKVVTETVFEYNEVNDSKEDVIRRECLPMASRKTKEDVERLMNNYGLGDIVLPETLWNLK